MRMLWPSLGILVVACGTETPRTFHADAGLPAAPFNYPAKVQGAADAGEDASTEEGGVADAGAAEAGAEPSTEAAPVSTALADVKPFTIALSFRAPNDLLLESADGQRFVHRVAVPPGTWFATQRTELTPRELAYWTSQSTMEIVFTRGGDKLIVARVRAGKDAGAGVPKEYRFAAPAGATLFVEARPAP